jgi:protein disulfide-isomerase A6
MKFSLAAIAALALVGGANAGAIELTESNFDAEVMQSGKSAFIKFLAPW